MKFLIVASVCIVVVLCQQTIQPKPNIRNLPAEVKPQAPGQCFAFTANKAFAVGQSWPLAPFCGRATCIQHEGKLFEKVEDCGFEPKPSPGCRVVNEADQGKPYPACCPVYQCQPGASLQYPTEQELRAAAQRNAQTAQRG
ncbi:U-scoloptoxin(16)-Er8a-like [Macrobrachium nipponense]|uniref:U-scoloptoxin(16)-Er8a-like n=1 Tax=Macrobrachium nipponense TaxID=159736 RepID=UPI0030C88598